MTLSDALPVKAIKVERKPYANSPLRPTHFLIELVDGDFFMPIHEPPPHLFKHVSGVHLGLGLTATAFEIFTLETPVAILILSDET